MSHPCPIINRTTHRVAQVPYSVLYRFKSNSFPSLAFVPPRLARCDVMSCPVPPISPSLSNGNISRRHDQNLLYKHEIKGFRIKVHHPRENKWRKKKEFPTMPHPSMPNDTRYNDDADQPSHNETLHARSPKKKDPKPDINNKARRIIGAGMQYCIRNRK